jgi:hypothetical protein
MIYTKCKPQGDRFSILEISPRLAICYQALARPGKGGRRDKIQCAYFGFETQEEAQQFASYMRKGFLPFGPRVLVREPERLTECGWEVKVWEFPHLLEVILKCANKQQQAS